MKSVQKEDSLCKSFLGGLFGELTNIFVGIFRSIFLIMNVVDCHCTTIPST